MHVIFVTYNCDYTMPTFLVMHELLMFCVHCLCRIRLVEGVFRAGIPCNDFKVSKGSQFDCGSSLIL